jgi:hypothetical protein
VKGKVTADDLNAQKDKHIIVATAAVYEYLTSNTDFLWLEAFCGGRDPTAQEAKKFFNTYQLHRQGKWHYDLVVEQIKLLRSNQQNVDVDTLATNLGYCVPAKRHKHTDRQMKLSRQLSAASKITFFCFPDKDNFILDSLATAALELRSGAKKIVKSYGTYWEVAASELSKEDDKFEAAVNAYLALPDTRRDLPESFIRRYFFDKLLLAQGRWIKRQRS